jgi:death-on-curing protein
VKEPDFLTLAEVVDIHAFQLEQHGGRPGLRDPGLLESAIAVPQSTFGGELLHPTLFAMAAAYAYHIAENQPFIDGNKRAALGAALVFLDINGVAIEDPKGRLYDAMIDISARKLSKEQLGTLLEQLSK